MATVSQTGTGRSDVIAADNFQGIFNIGLLIALSGSATFNIEVSPDDPVAATPSGWFTVSGLTGLTAGSAISLTVPCKAISINVTGGNGKVTLTTVQSGPLV